MKTRYLIILICLWSLNSFGQSKSRFSKEVVVRDLQYLYESVKDAHYDLFAYITEEKFDSTYREVHGSIVEDSLTLLEVTGIFQQLISVVDNGHTEIDFPGQSYGAYAYGGGTIFPLEVAIEQGKPLVRKNWSNDNSINAGSEILAINGVSMAEILSHIYPHISAERLYLKHAKIEMYSFPRYYWQVYGEQKDFDVEIRSSGKVNKHVLTAIDVIDDYEMKRAEVLNATMQLRFFRRSAYLNPGNFSGDEQKYRHFIDSAFTEITARKCQDLIIDLRNNGGGDNAFSDYLVSYFADRPFKWCSDFSIRTSEFLKDHVRQHYDTTDAYWQKVLAHENGEIYEYKFGVYAPQPEPTRFAGNVYVLINRQSHSQAAVTAAQIQDYGFGTIVGEETGDYPSLYASQFQYGLPNTGITVKVSKGYIVRVNGSTEAQGVIPDIPIKDHLLDEHDEILEGLLNKIDEKG